MPEFAKSKLGRKAFIVPPGGGRRYPMGPLTAVFKADLGETAELYSVSEWWLEPRTGGPTPHQHEDEHIFYVLEGTLSVSLDGAWSEASAGAYIVIPGGVLHTFENRSGARAGFISFNTPGGFEERMAHIAPAMAAADLSL